MLRLPVIALLLSSFGCYANPVIVVFTGLPSNTEHGTYNGFIEATVNGIPKQLLICDDEQHATIVPSQDLIYDFSDFNGNASSLQHARFISPGGPTAMDVFKYEEAAVLLYGLAQAQTAEEVTDYQYAIWNLFTPTFQLFRPVQQQALQTQAALAITSNAEYLTAAYSSMRIFTPFQGLYEGREVDYSSNQEFLQSTVPEPSLLVPLGGLLLAVIRWRKRSTLPTLSSAM